MPAASNNGTTSVSLALNDNRFKHLISGSPQLDALTLKNRKPLDGQSRTVHANQKENHAAGTTIVLRANPDLLKAEADTFTNDANNFGMRCL